MHKLASLLKLVRLHNCLIAAAGVWLGGYLSSSGHVDAAVFLTSVAAGLVCGAGNAFNDYRDIESDRLNHPSRPLPLGSLSPATAVVTALLLNCCAVVLCLIVNLWVLCAVVVSILLLFLYNLRLKRVVFWGNLLVSILGGATFLTGALAVTDNSLTKVPGPVVPAIFAVLFHLGRELVKDIADKKGDRAVGYRTIANAQSDTLVLLLATLIFMILVILTLVPISGNWYRHSYAVIAVALVDLPLVVVVLYLWTSKSVGRFRVSGSYLKLLMIFGLLAFVAGKA